MKIFEWLTIGALLVSQVVIAEETNPYTGTWHINTVSKKGSPREGTLIIKDKDGIWDINWINVKNSCAGLPSPIIIKEASADSLVFEINKSKALRGCGDKVATLKRVSETTLEGKLDDGREIMLVKE